MSRPLPRRLHVQRAAEVLQDSVRGSKPTDQLLETLFRQHKEMGKRDRASVSDLVYGVLRDVLRLQALAGAAPADWLARHLADADHPAEAITTLGLTVPCADSPVSAAAACNLPAPWHARLTALLGDADVAALAASLNRPAPTDVRVNTLLTTRDAARAALAAEGVTASDTPSAPQGLRLAQRLSRQSPLLLSGHLEPQDEGSQLLALFAGARAGDTVIDWCAGAGGKSLAMAALMQNEGRIVACDISAGRLARLPPRAVRDGVRIVSTQPHGEGAVLPPADVVLVDAPCSGSGTLRRAPELRLRTIDLAALAALQARILDDAAALVKPGGRLVYATCSLFEEENEAIVAGFLARHPGFAPAAAPADFPPSLATADGRLRLWPHRHGMDGFFAQALQRRD